jgi:ABC-type antimicrobial peptide transport system permease subunit
VGFDPDGTFYLEGDDIGDGSASYRVVGPDFFEALGTTLIRGRSFTDADGPGAENVIVINQRMADQFFANQDPIGQTVRTGGMDSRGREFTTVVGVVDNVRHRSLDAPASAGYYLTYRQRPDRIGTMTLVVVPSGPAATLAEPIRSAIRALDPNVPIEMRSLDALVGQPLAERRFMLTVWMAFAAVALGLSALGTYGVVAFSVARRTRDIGIRLALGAESPRVFWSVTASILTSVGIGTSVGLVAAAVLARLLAPFLFDVRAADPVTFGAVALLTLGTACVAVWVPARRAVRVSPTAALRMD